MGIIVGQRTTHISRARALADRFRRVTTSAHNYIPEIDGLRFIAIFSVILFHVYWMTTHVTGRVLTPSSVDVLLQPIRYGFRGVELFFVISGFILGLPFAFYHLANGRKVSLRRYYLRRVTRLEPPYIVTLLAFYAAAMVLRTPDVTQPGFWSGLLLRLGYLHTAFRGVPTLNGVTWTLEVEVQFYLLAPLLAGVFMLSAPWRRTLLAVLIGSFPILAPQVTVPNSQWTLIAYAHFFLLGFLLADLHVSKLGPLRLAQRFVDFLGLLALLALFLVPPSAYFTVAEPWLLAVMVLAAFHGNWFTRTLRQPLITLFGGMCYSLYLLHSPILSFVGQRVVHDGMSALVAYARVAAIGVPAVLGAGILLYVFLERPCMNPNWPNALISRFNRFHRPPHPTTPANIAAEQIVFRDVAPRD
jgi:peptidoglycan/LPS O-acetylase OafA/YrhL